ncbi:MAG: nucleoside hydrolase [Butyrivibrio sp.]|uniref:nucleoside hydrolase n=1 Tax=Butyrivibrio sp. TaxID=28121 RepID=UPI001B143163|nr:nucleoside hydrolase [Butyrivibrio sp.]MBO6241002.1 nucleoside hydrolase [Butyrivibrio sp.]
MIKFNIPDEKKVRVILDTDAKNEVDDQFAIVQALLSESMDLKALVAAHFGTGKSEHSMKDSYDEIQKLLDLMHMNGQVNVVCGGERAMSSEDDLVESEGARFIVEEAMKDDDRPLYVAFLGPLTDMAAALKMEPRIAKKNLTVIWIGGRDWPIGGWEYNLSNDVAAANYVFKSDVQLWQVPRNVYRMMPVSFAEMYDKVYPCGEVGKYLVENVIAFNNEDKARPIEYRCLGDSPAVGIIMFNDCGEWDYKPAPSFDEKMNYIHEGKYRPIKVYKNIDNRFILEDFFAKLRLFTS